MKELYLFYVFSWIMFNLSLMFFVMGLYMFNYDFMLMLNWNFMNIMSLKLDYLMLFDWIVFIYLSVVLLIMSMILLYSVDYMMGDMKILRFFLLLNLFVLSMLLMIISPNMISILLGWDGLGLVSYCLVIYYHNVSSYNSGMVTVLLNRVGDVMIMLIISLMLFNYSLNFFLKFSLMNVMIVILFLISGMTKSAQIPFSSWLPLAMAAPTPVSSLVHSSTLVTAGVYLLIRFNKVIFNSVSCSNILMYISIMTMFMSGLVANFELDVKKIVALSTLSQLGLMMMILSLGYEMLSFFHLIMHALFKSLLFMCMGYIIHNFNNIQDMRFMGSMSFMSPYIMMSLIVANLALCGFPFLSGFFSKDLILEKIIFINLNFYVFILFLLSIGLTVSYTMRMVLCLYMKNLVMKGVFKFDENNMMNYSMIILSVFSVVMGLIFMWNYFDWIDLNILSNYVKIFILFLIILGGLMGVFFYKLINSFELIYFFIYYNGLMWNMMYLLKMLYVNLFMNIEFYNKNIEKGWNEMIGFKMIELLVINNMKNGVVYYFVLLLMYMLLIIYFLLIMLF
uniref:NADH-ubiquinone oxidoreductase chain 5 n=1 Tax=Gasteruption sp. M19 TaxID=162239 RepID=A0A096XMX5_9HYME|nr:NADH dehydrogenase subunit 5 [Gasteruption sp. M19]